ncbi:hypothetical protein H257_08203 [Aphanomyces astaci]|uniref:Uncharacterized protein n=1 Tax=Aphanomyces astaci TaxID=112090 RepID=W4GE62_APHAT|nr:hypothetical protein H257_08203 [Aphanomyces astaci]ETV77977.1 hypothetical protein H257_08203 [Aphanomyces astaci]|eukprot:XP_009832314.1 hypothetical protein H257_08203 [Aphanomyces astaci]
MQPTAACHEPLGGKWAPWFEDDGLYGCYELARLARRWRRLAKGGASLTAAVSEPSFCRTAPSIHLHDAADTLRQRSVYDATQTTTFLGQVRRSSFDATEACSQP